jgi:hypothetical protein
MAVRHPTATSPTWNFAADAAHIEIRFPERPPAEIRDSLRRMKWRWSAAALCWYARKTPANLRLAEQFTHLSRDSSAD